MCTKSSGACFKAYCTRVESTVNSDILGCTTRHAKNGQWQVPPDRKDQKKLGDVKLSGLAANKFMDGFDYLVSAYTKKHSSEYTDQ